MYIIYFSRGVSEITFIGYAQSQNEFENQKTLGTMKLQVYKYDSQPRLRLPKFVFQLDIYVFYYKSLNIGISLRSCKNHNIKNGLQNDT